MKTPLDQLIEQIDNEVKVLSNLHGKEIFGRKVGLAFAKRVALELKEKEKEYLVNAHFNGCETGEMFNNENRAFITDAEKYYNETFKQEEQ